MNKSNYLYYTNDHNELLRRDRDLQIHQQKLEEIKRSKSAFAKQRNKSVKLQKFTNLKDEMKYVEIFQNNQLLAYNLAKIHSRPMGIININQNQSPLKNSHSKDKKREYEIKIKDDNINLCRRILDQQSQIAFKQKLMEFKEHQKIKKRLLRVKRQFEQQEKLGTDQRVKSKSFSQVQNPKD